jgi:ATP diphosphatase
VSAIDRLRAVMARLRDPEDGCPWDREQDFASIAPYTIEEAYEVADAIARQDLDDLRDELGDLLLQVVYHAQMASEQGAFDFDDVAEAIRDKLVRRHPHVFGDAAGRRVEAVRRTWEDTKAREREARHRRRTTATGQDAPDPFDGVPLALPALRRAAKIQERARREGLLDDALDARASCEAALAAVPRPGASGDRDAARARVGELLFRIVAMARRLGVDPERALAERTAEAVRAARARVRG